jgi:polysaccharide biosynthesis protein PslH
MRILFLSRWYPDPPDNGSKIRISNLLRSLVQKHRVTLISFVDPDAEVAAGETPSPGVDETKICRYREFRPRSRRAMAGFLAPTPRWILDTYRPEMASLIRESVQRTRFDLVIASQTSMAVYYDSFRGIPAVFEELELGTFYPGIAVNGSSCWAEMRAHLRWAKHRRFIERLMRHFRMCTVASENEEKLLAACAPDFQNVHVIPNSLDMDAYDLKAPSRSSDSMIFAGSIRYTANHDAMNWFMREILPIIRSERKDANLTITGDPGGLRLISAPDVLVTGRVRNVAELIAASAVSVVPIRIGGGTRLKILESFALNTPVVSTSKAAEGLEVTDGIHCLIADTPGDFAKAVIRVMQEPEAAGRMASRAHAYVCSRFDWRIHSERFLDLIQNAAGMNAAPQG